MGSTGAGFFTHTDLAGHWPVDTLAVNNSFKDISGSNNAMTAFGSPTLVNGQLRNMAVKFDNPTDYLTVDHIDLVATQSFTISVWIRPELGKSSYAPLVYGTAGGLRYAQTSDNIQLAFNNASGIFTQITASSTELPYNQWSLVSAVYDANGDEARIYINAELIKTQTNIGGLDVSKFNGDVSFQQIGADSGGSRYFVGSLDDIRIYNMASSESEIKNLYHRNMLVGHLALNENDGNIAHDVSVYSTNNGTISGTSTWLSGKVGSHALEFDGATTQVQVDHVPLWHTSGHTISVYVKPNGIQSEAWTPFVHYWETGGIRFNNNSNFIQFSVRDAAGNVIEGVSNTEIADNEWTMLTMVADPQAGLNRLYINGVLDKEIPFTSLSSIYYDGDVKLLDIGGRYNGTRYFKGSLDDLRIYNRALNPNEVAELAGLSIVASNQAILTSPSSSTNSAWEDFFWPGSGNYIFAARKTAGVSVIDVSYPASPVIYTNRTHNLSGGEESDSCRAAILVGNDLFTITRSGSYPTGVGRFEKWDATDPGNISPALGSGVHENTALFSDMDTDGVNIFVAGQKSGAYKFSAAAAGNAGPTNSNTSGNWETQGLVVHNDYVYFANYGFGVRVLSADTFEDIGSAPAPLVNSVALRPWDCVARGDYLYCSSNTSGSVNHKERGLLVFDISTPSQISFAEASSIPEKDQSTWNTAGDKPLLGISILENNVCIANGDRGNVCWDISDPIKPAYLGLFSSLVSGDQSQTIELFQYQDQMLAIYGDGSHPNPSSNGSKNIYIDSLNRSIGDTDTDGLNDHIDNCPTVYNPAQTDTDADLKGDLCDADDDNDGYIDRDDAFAIDGSEQLDSDGDANISVTALINTTLSLKLW